MRVLVVYATKMGGTRGLAEMVGHTLEEEGVDAVVAAADEIRDVTGFDAVVVGGALYAFRWHKDARRFVRRHREDLSTMPVWLFSSGPLDDSASAEDIDPVRGVAAAMRRIGARGHVTFGGRMPADATGFPAAAMARDNTGDWRDPDHVAAWTREVVAELRRPAVPVD
ncbi:flavodoxin domain-containing protein [Salsipaludibacter albus]|uniref:flavodoxin domain-containing protein n=1 Tax=Salsipaludibacter albus TaxID=2849650 RepID=UPI001EE4E83F|nr:flavodoxin domain-containing protein [Salsipaludibacter albus]MBY5161191.1 flavodoxin [Salsipaludibacter albus]